MTKRLTDTEIRLRIVPTLLRWPAAEIAKSVGWDKLRECVDALRALVFAVDQKCIAAENDRDLSPEGVARRRAAIGKEVLTELSNYKPFQSAEQAVARDVAAMEQRMTDLPKPPGTFFDVEQASKIRDYISKQKSPHDFVSKHMSDPRVVGAVLNAPAFLSGLGDAEWNFVRERARAALHPTQVEMTAAMQKALGEVREGVVAAKRILLERCEMREDDDGEFRSIREPQPSINLTEKARKLKEATA